MKRMLIFLSLFFFSISAHAESSITDVSYHIALLGDSILYWSRAEIPLRLLLPNSTVENYGIPCETPLMIARRVQINPSKRQMGHCGFTKSALDPSNYDIVVVLAGYNGLDRGAQPVIDDLAVIYKNLKQRALTVVAMTLPPFGSYGEWTPKKQAIADKVNEWILSKPSNVDVTIDLNSRESTPNPVPYSVVDNASTRERPAQKKSLTMDGLHFNPKGGETLAYRIFKAMQ